MVLLRKSDCEPKSYLLWFKEVAKRKKSVPLGYDKKICESPDLNFAPLKYLHWMVS